MTSKKIVVSKRHRFEWLARQIPSPEDQREYARERCIVALTETIAAHMNDIGLTRSQVAARIGVTKGHVSQLLSGRRNMTLRSLADLLWACGMEVQDVALAPLGVAIVPEEMLCDVQVADAEIDVPASLGNKREQPLELAANLGAG